MERIRTRVFCTQKTISCYLPVHKEMAKRKTWTCSSFLCLWYLSISKDAGRIIAAVFLRDGNVVLSMRVPKTASRKDVRSLYSLSFE